MTLVEGMLVGSTAYFSIGLVLAVAWFGNDLATNKRSRVDTAGCMLVTVLLWMPVLITVAVPAWRRLFL